MIIKVFFYKINFGNVFEINLIILIFSNFIMCYKILISNVLVNRFFIDDFRNIGRL